MNRYYNTVKWKANVDVTMDFFLDSEREMMKSASEGTMASNIKGVARYDPPDRHEANGDVQRPMRISFGRALPAASPIQPADQRVGSAHKLHVLPL